MNPRSSSIKSFFRLFSYGPRVRPTRDWLVLLSGFAILLLASVLWNVVQYAHVVKGEKIGNAEVQAPGQIQLDAVQALFAARAAERAKYQGTYRFVDPSR